MPVDFLLEHKFGKAAKQLSEQAQEKGKRLEYGCFCRPDTMMYISRNEY